MVTRRQKHAFVELRNGYSPWAESVSQHGMLPGATLQLIHTPRAQETKEDEQRGLGSYRKAVRKGCRGRTGITVTETLAHERGIRCHEMQSHACEQGQLLK